MWTRRGGDGGGRGPGPDLEPGVLHDAARGEPLGGVHHQQLADQDLGWGGEGGQRREERGGARGDAGGGGKRSSFGKRGKGRGSRAQGLISGGFVG